MIWTILFQMLIIEFCHRYTSINLVLKDVSLKFSVCLRLQVFYCLCGYTLGYLAIHLRKATVSHEPSQALNLQNLIGEDKVWSKRSITSL